MSEICRLEKVSKVYTAIEQVTPVKELDFTVHAGDFISFAGTSGTGKSTLLYLMGGLLQPTSGEIYFSNRKLSEMNDTERTRLRAEKIGFIFQEYRFIEAMNIKDNLMFAAKANPNNRPSEETVDELLDTLDLLERKFHFPHELSGGQKRRVMILAALIKNPALILADEPTNDLDDGMVERVMRLFQREVDRGKALVLVTHDRHTSQAARIQYSMHQGEIHLLNT